MKVIARPPFADLVEALDRHHERLAEASAGLLETIGYLDETESWGDDETSLSCFLSARYAVTSGTAWEWVRVARALRSLPAIREAHAAGRISWDQLRPLTRFAAPETDERLALDVPGSSPGRLWREAHRHERAQKQKELESDRQMRYLRMEWDEQRRFSISRVISRRRRVRLSRRLSRGARRMSCSRTECSTTAAERGWQMH